jgi:hypothetical protein
LILAARRGTLAPMATPLTISIPHQLGRAEARRRIESGFAKTVGGLPGGGGHCSQRWEGDRLVFSVAVLAQTITGTVEVGDATVTMEIHLPGVLGLVASGFRSRLQKAGQLLLEKK